jgi:hypothetical protein
MGKWGEGKTKGKAVNDYPQFGFSCILSKITDTKTAAGPKYRRPCGDFYFLGI